jgi:hypothetical protein
LGHVLLTTHNVHFLLDLMAQMRAAIAADRFDRFCGRVFEPLSGAGGKWGVAEPVLSWLKWQVARWQGGKAGGWVTFYLLLFTCYFLLLACQAREAAPPPPVTMPAETAVVRLGVVSSATTLADLAAEAYEADGVFVEFVPGNQAALLADLASRPTGWAAAAPDSGRQTRTGLTRWRWMDW